MFKTSSFAHAYLPRLALLLAAALVACGGGGNDAEPPVASRVSVEVVAGPTSEADGVGSPSQGCVDGVASAVILALDAKLALGTDGNTLFTGEADCEGRPRVRRIDLEGNTISTLARGGTLPDGDGPFALENFVSVQAIAQTSDGSLLIADSEAFSGDLTISGRDKPGLGNGVWRLSPDGQLTQLAGFAQPARTAAADGVGPTAVFENIEAICQGERDTFYVHNGGSVRKLTLDGTVTTLRATDGARASHMVCGETSRNLITNSQGQLELLPGQQTFASIDGKVGSIYGLADGTTVWVSNPARNELMLMDIATGTALEGSSIKLATFDEPAQLASPPYTLRGLRPFTFRAATGQVAYAATRYSIIKLTYK